MKEKSQRNIKTPKEIAVTEDIVDNFQKSINNILNKLRKSGIHKMKVCHDKELQN